MSFFSTFELSTIQWVMIIFGAFVTGMGRTGIFGVTILVVPLLSLFIPGKEAAGLVLPMMIAGDFVAVYVYRKTYDRSAFSRILPWLILGVLLGMVIGGAVSDSVFKKIMAGTTFTCAAFVIWNEIRHGKPVKLNFWTVAVIGTLSGFASMIGNAAGPIIAVYFLALRLKKVEYISSIAWLFWIVNLVKLPMHIFVWKTVSQEVLKIDLVLIPALIAGLIAGVWFIKKIPEKPFRIVIIVSVIVAAIMLLI